jgi:hypothetical protein
MRWDKISSRLEIAFFSGVGLKSKEGKAACCSPIRELIKEVTTVRGAWPVNHDGNVATVKSSLC